MFVIVRTNAHEKDWLGKFEEAVRTLPEIQGAHRMMRKALTEGFAARGVSVRKLRYEEFEIRSGIGLTALAACLTDRMKPVRRAPADGAG